MVSLIIEWALFFLVLFLLVPAMVIFAILMRNIIHHNLKQSVWRKGTTDKPAGL